VAVGIVALSKNAAVFLCREIRVVIEMRGGKLNFSREKNHGCSLISPIRELQRNTPGLSIRFFPLHGSGRTPRAQLYRAPRRAHNRRCTRRGNGYERDQSRSSFGGQAGAKPRGKAERGTSVPGRP